MRKLGSRLRKWSWSWRAIQTKRWRKMLILRMNIKLRIINRPSKNRRNLKSKYNAYWHCMKNIARRMLRFRGISIFFWTKSQLWKVIWTRKKFRRTSPPVSLKPTLVPNYKWWLVSSKNTRRQKMSFLRCTIVSMTRCFRQWRRQVWHGRRRKSHWQMKMNEIIINFVW